MLCVFCVFFWLLFFADIWKILNTDIFLIDTFGGIERMLIKVYCMKLFREQIFFDFLGKVAAACIFQLNR